MCCRVKLQLSYGDSIVEGIFIYFCSIGRFEYHLKIDVGSLHLILLATRSTRVMIQSSTPAVYLQRRVFCGIVACIGQSDKAVELAHVAGLADREFCLHSLS